MPEASIEEKVLLDLIRNTINDFCMDFVQNPYKCYTEHGQHALFYSMLMNALPEHQRYITFEGKQVCILQKEYPTAANLDKSKRQHWDIAILKSPAESLIRGRWSYDYLKIFTTIEFGMNESENHLQDDIERLCNRNCNIDHQFIVHLYRLSESGNLFSNRDWSSKSPRICTLKRIQELKGDKPVEIFYGMADSTGKYDNGVWRL